jgi:hypothetical protein
MRAPVADCGIRVRITVHSLRHLFSTHMLELGVDLRELQGILGHVSPTTARHAHLTDVTSAQARAPGATARVVRAALGRRIMIRLAEVAEAFVADREAWYAEQLLPEQRNALSAILRFRTEECGAAAIHCHDCEREDSFPLSCGHRACPQCQNEAVEQRLERQRAKLLPVDYYLITFTLPAQLRTLAYANQREAYDQLIKLAWQTLSELGLNDKTLRGKLGATAVLHTHSRALDFHPHVHIVVPAGAIDPVHNRWRTKQGKFLFPRRRWRRSSVASGCRR